MGRFVNVERFGKVEKKFWGGSGSGKSLWKSMRFVKFSDGSLLKWSRKSGKFRFESGRMDRKSIQGESLMRWRLEDSMDQSRLVKDMEEFDYEGMKERMIGLVGEEKFVEIVKWMSGQ